MWHTDTGWAAWTAMAIGMVVFWGLLIWAIASFMQGGTLFRRTAPPTPEEILAERLARGEVDPSEYRERLEALRLGADRRGAGRSDRPPSGGG